MIAKKAETKEEAKRILRRLVSEERKRRRIKIERRKS